MNTWHKYDAISPNVRALVTRIKYGNATAADLVTLLRREADKVEHELRTNSNQQQQGRLNL